MPVDLDNLADVPRILIKAALRPVIGTRIQPTGIPDLGPAEYAAPDGKGGTWLHHRSEPPILHVDASGKIVQTFGDKMFVQAHGFCRDRDGNFWAGDSGPFNDTPSTAGRGFQMFKFSPEGKLLLTLGKAGVSRAGDDTFNFPAATATRGRPDR